MTVHDKMAALFVNLFKMALRRLNGKQVSQNVAQIAKNFFQLHPTNAEVLLKTKLTIWLHWMNSEFLSIWSAFL